jgi:subtilisin family serine protease
MKFFLCLSLLALAALSQGSLWKVQKEVRDALAKESTTNILVSFRSTEEVLAQATAAFPKNAGKGQKATIVYEHLKAHAQKSQKSALEFLAANHKGKIRSFWITNQIWVEGADSQLIAALSVRKEVTSINEDGIVTVNDQLHKIEFGVKSGPSPRAEWGIEMVRAEDAWALAGGNNGAGVIVGITDTGTRGTHEAIAAQYVGAAMLGWYDPIYGHQEPSDGHGHGTHVTGTACGTHGIGVAPGAKWRSCKGLNNQGSGSNADLIACGEFHLCPHDANGQNPDCNLRSDIVSNSWGTAFGGNTFYNQVIAAQKAAGMIPVFAAGNSGSGCSTIGSPADSSSGPIAVGATTETNGVASFSSRGPTLAGALAPQISAPGTNTRSASHLSDTGYATMSGTSMACPHVAGMMALVLGHDDWSMDEAHGHVQNNSHKGMNGGGQTCGGISDGTYPNHIFGHGRIDAYATLLHLIENTKK